MTTITLPPLPSGALVDDRHWYTPDQLRARDLEVARLVLESLADEFSDWHGAKLIVSTIRATEVKHHE